ncbi:endonuclease 8-like 1 [Mya arenaria]|uniref:endonuclease 8-like 1 n=1 Tax=Mya arenaria TaxID=6604 RepID=UPI0022E737EB|nr:endonuclease 8-like 1 [Mya arenaria]
MPEGPELYLASRFINRVCKGRVFQTISKSEISKNPMIMPPCSHAFGKAGQQTYFTISATSRGKELKITLLDVASSKNTTPSKCEFLDSQCKLDVLFTFGLAGKFDWLQAGQLEKHSHLNFFTCDNGPKMVLSFIDYMRFGKWTPGADFSFKARGPCTLLEYDRFRENVLSNLANNTFNKPICEVLLNQRFFNGIGNYLRAEILHRVKVPPFVSARSVLEPLTVETVVKTEQPDILQLCHILPQEVLQLEGSWYDGKDRENKENAFNNWLQCYYQDGMKTFTDHNKRTIWYSGPLGPLAPKDGKVRAQKSPKKRSKKEPEKELLAEDYNNPEKESHPRKSKQKPTKVPNGKYKRKSEDKRFDSDTSSIASSDSVSGRLTRGSIKKIVEETEKAAESGWIREKKISSVKGVLKTDSKEKSAKKPRKRVYMEIKTEEAVETGSMGVDTESNVMGNHLEGQTRKPTTKKKARLRNPLQKDAPNLNSTGGRKGSVHRGKACSRNTPS